MDTYFEELLQKSETKTLTELKQEEEQTRQERIVQSFDASKNNAEYILLKYYARLYLKEDLKQTNQAIYEILTTTDEKVARENFLQDKWSLVLNPLLIRMYYYFGSLGAGSLEKHVEDVILRLLWERMLHKNDISLAKKSTWHMTGSENHDLNAKICSLISSQIFMNLKEYKDKVYPNEGKGGGYGYWFHNMYEFMGGDIFEGDGPKGKASLSDGNDYTSKEHYNAWVSFFMEYIKERAKKGFFLEVCATGYMKWTLSFLSIGYEFCQDKELKKLFKDFFDLIWCEWAQDQIKGRRGGAKTRFVFEDKQMQQDSMYYLAKFYFGGAGIAGHAHYFQMLSDYKLPLIVWDLVINQKELGEYEYFSRKPGEEENVFPRPKGEERTLLCDTNSRLLRYSFVTPDYILGTQMDSPIAIHSHLSCAKRQNGLIMEKSADSYLFPTTFEPDDNGDLKPNGGMYRSVQYRNILICQQHRGGYFKIDPEWFPNILGSTSKYGIYLGKKFELFLEEGWVFLQGNNTFVAMRPAYGKFEILDNKILFDDPYAPAIIHTDRLQNCGSFEAFKRRVLANSLIILQTVVPKFYRILYKTKEVEIEFNASNNQPPTVNGEIINYEYPYTFFSPYMKSKYNSGEILVQSKTNTLKFKFI